MQHYTQAQHPRSRRAIATLAAFALVASLIPAASFALLGSALATSSTTATNKVQLHANVTLTDEDDPSSELTIPAHQFRFYVLDSTGEQIRTTTNDSDAAKGDAGAGDVTFNAIRFTEAGTYTYYITQVNKGAAGYGYDTSAYKVTVTATEDSSTGDITTSVEYDDTAIEDLDTYLSSLSTSSVVEEEEAAEDEEATDEEATEEEATENAKLSTLAASDDTEDSDDAEEAEGPTFANTYTASNTLTLTAWKNLENGGELEAGEFTFQLQAVTVTEGTDEDGNTTTEVATGTDGSYTTSTSTPMPAGSDGTTNTTGTATTTNGTGDDTSLITFDIEYSLSDVGSTYYYVLSEVADEGATTEDGELYGDDDDDVYKYDTNTYLYAVTVYDDGDGTLSFDQTVTSLVTNEALASDEPTFTNVMKDGSLTIAKTVSDNSQDDGTDDDFTFSVTLSGEGISSSGSYDYTVYDEDGSYTVYSGSSSTSYDSDGNEVTDSSSDGSGDADGDDTDGSDSTDADDADADADSTLSTQAIQAEVQQALSTACASVKALATMASLATQADDEDETVTFPVTGTTSDNGRTGSKYLNGCTWVIEEVTETTTTTDEDTGEETTAETVTGYSLSIYPTAAASDLSSYLNSSSSDDSDDTDDDDTTTDGDGTTDDDTTDSDTTDDTTSGKSDSGKSDSGNTSGGGNSGMGTKAVATASDDDTTDDATELTIAEFFAQAEEDGTTYAGYLGADKNTDAGPWCAYADYITEAHVYGDITCGSYLQSMFEGCEYMESVDGLENMDTTSVSNVESMFKDCASLTDVSDMEDWDISSMKSFEFMFANCTSLVEIDLPTGEKNSSSTWELEDLKYMFFSCESLEKITGLQDWDTSNVTSLRCLFYGCESLWYIGNDDNDGDYGDGMSGWDVSNVTNMAYLFHGCLSLTSLDLSEWDTSKVTTFEHMFSSYAASETEDTDYGLTYVSYGASAMSLVVLRIGSGWDTTGAESFSYMFAGCSKLMRIIKETTTTDDDGTTTTSYDYNGMAGWDVSDAEAMDYMFYNCSSLTEVDVSDWELNDSYTASSLTSNSKGLALQYMFYGCSQLGKDYEDDATISYTVTDRETGEETTYSLPARTLDEAIDVSAWDMSCVTRMENMFQNCSSLTTELDVSSWDVSHVYYMYAVFAGCSSLTTLDVSAWDTGSATYMDRLFRNCSSLTELDVSNFDTADVTRMGQMFENCSSLTELDLSSFDTGKVSGVVDASNRLYYGMGSMFNGCTRLQVVTFGENWSFYGKSGTNRDSSVCTPAYLPDAGCDSGMWVRVDATYGPYESGISYTSTDTDTTNYFGTPLTEGYSTDTLTDQWGVEASAALMSGTWVWYYPSGSYQVAFSAGASGSGYDGEMATMTVDLEGEGFSVPANQFQREGYEFTGWSATVVDASGEDVGSGFSIDEESEVSSTFAKSSAAATLTYTYTASSDDDSDDSSLSTQASSSSSGTVKVGAGYVITLTAQWEEEASESSKGTWTTTITLHAGQYAVFETLATHTTQSEDGTTSFEENIPYGTTYTVTEKSLGSGWSLVETSQQASSSATATTGSNATVSGEVPSNDTATVTYTNEYVPTATTVALGGVVYLDSKLLSVVSAYTYSLYEGQTTSSEALLTATNNASGVFQFEDSSVAAPTGYSYGTLKFTEAGTYYYAITQTNGTLESSTYDYDNITHDTHTEYVKVVVTDVSAALTATVYYSDVAWDESDGSVGSGGAVSEAGAEFENFTKGTLAIYKTVTGTEATNKSFTFTVTLTDSSGTTLTDSYSYTESSSSTSDTTSTTGSITSGGTITLKAGQSVTITGLPAGTKYEVTEDTSSMPSGYSLSSSSGTSGTISSTSASEATFVNSYSATSTSWTPSVTKVLEGGVALSAGAFSFTLVDADGDDDDALMTGTNAAGSLSDGSATGAVTLEDSSGDTSITYDLDEAGTYTYTITETAGNLSYYTYDSTVWTVTVTVVDDGDGTMSTSAVYSYSYTDEDGNTVTVDKDDDGNTLTSATFTNTFSYEGAELPEAGGAGLGWRLLACGLAVLLTAAAAALYLTRRRKRPQQVA